MRFSVQTLIWFFVLIAALIVGVMAFIPKPESVETATVVEGPLRVSVQEDGKTRIREKYIVSAPVAGRLSRIELQPGDVVNDEDSLIAVIVPAEPIMLDARSKAQAKSRVEQADATLRRSEANAEQIRINYELSKTKFERARKMRASISHEEYDIARTEFLASSQSNRTTKFDSEIAQFELEMAKAALLQFSDTEASAEPFEIFSPVSGKVLRVFQESSTVLNVGTPLIELGDPQNLEIEIDVLSTDAVKIAYGAELTVEHWGGGEPLKGRVRVVEPAAFTKISSLGVEEQRVNIIADFDESPERLATLGDGYRVEARITIDDVDNVLQIPNSALFRHERQWHVFVVNGVLAEKRPVTIGIQNETHTQILDGLDPNDEVIIYPNDNIASGSKIKKAEN